MAWSRKRKIWTFAGGAAALLFMGIGLAGYLAAQRLEPTLREKTIEYLTRRFDANVELASLKVRAPLLASLKGFFTASGPVEARVNATGILFKLKSLPDRPPMARLSSLEFRVDLRTVNKRPLRVTKIKVTGLEINIPPKGSRPSLGSGEPKTEPHNPSEASVVIDTIEAHGTRLSILPADLQKRPLIFELHKLTLEEAGPGRPMRYVTELTNPKPPGLIQCQGTFGPWVSASPSDTPLTGDYTFEKADLGVFKGIAGILASTGKFSGTLDNITVDGETRTPDFRLTRGGNPVPLETKFHAIVDGRNGNTLLQPVDAKLGNSEFTVQGVVARDLGEQKKTIMLDAEFQRGYIQDAVSLAMSGKRPFLKGPLKLKARIEIPPGQGTVSERIEIAGKFRLDGAHFTSTAVQNQIDKFSRMGSGKPDDESIEDVPTILQGDFRLANGNIRFRRLFFSIPGSQVSLTGDYSFRADELDFRGQVRLDARVSETQKGWKRVALKPVDPFFAKKGAGTLANIQITGTREKPKFGLARGDKDKEAKNRKK